MIKLSIITINFNNAYGLKKTMESVFSQTYSDFEYIIIDGCSSDESVDIISQFEKIANGKFNNFEAKRFKWISESDSGIYQAMNKGIRLATGEYCQFLNSGDILATTNVSERMMNTLPDSCEIFYGNMLKKLPKGIICDRGFKGRTPTMLDFYLGTLNHSPTYIKKKLFETFGFYDETLKIVSDWKWFLQVIAIEGVIPVYKNIDVTIFDMNGISNLNLKLDNEERQDVLKEFIPKSVIQDYEQNSFFIEQMKRINSYWITRKGVFLLERGLFKIEKWIKK